MMTPTPLSAKAKALEETLKPFASLSNDLAHLFHKAPPGTYLAAKIHFVQHEVAAAAAAISTEWDSVYAVAETAAKEMSV